MPSIYKALIIILSIGYATFWLAAKNLPDFIPNQTFRYWRNLWFFTVLAAFLTHNIWLFFAIILLRMIVLPTMPSPRVAYYFLLLCILPELPSLIPGFGGIKALFVLSYPRLLVITLFLTIFFTQQHKPKLFSLPTDRYIFLFVMLVAILNFRDNTITNSIRGIFLVFIDIFIPYFIISRSITTLKDMNQTMFALLISTTFLAVVGIFESTKHWLVYNELQLSLSGLNTHYDIRSGSLRALASFFSPIILGYVMVISFGILIYLKPFLKNRNLVYITGSLTFLCLLFTISRGAWLGFVSLITVYILTGKQALKRITMYGFLLLVSIPILNFTTVGNKYLELLPFIGSAKSDTIDYRERLLDVSWIVFQKNPIFGLTTFRDSPEMSSIHQASGVVDIVNTYIQIALEYGSIGLFLFIAIFFSLLIHCHQTIKKLPSQEVDLIRLGRTLFAILISILIMISTVSSINYIPIIYWALISLIAAYLHISQQTILSYSRKDTRASCKTLSISER